MSETAAQPVQPVEETATEQVQQVQETATEIIPEKEEKEVENKEEKEEEKTKTENLPATTKKEIENIDDIYKNLKEVLKNDHFKAILPQRIIGEMYKIELIREKEAPFELEKVNEYVRNYDNDINKEIEKAKGILENNQKKHEELEKIIGEEKELLEQLIRIVCEMSGMLAKHEEEKERTSNQINEVSMELYKMFHDKRDSDTKNEENENMKNTNRVEQDRSKELQAIEEQKNKEKNEIESEKKSQIKQLPVKYSDTDEDILKSIEQLKKEREDEIKFEFEKIDKKYEPEIKNLNENISQRTNKEKDRHTKRKDEIENTFNDSKGTLLESVKVEDTFCMDIEEMRQIEKWTDMKLSHIVFDTETEGYPSKTSNIFGLRMINKENLIFIIIDKEGNKFGGFIKSKITAPRTPIQDEKAFLFSLKSNGRLQGMEKFDITDSSCAFELWDDVDLFDFGEYDIRIKREERKNYSIVHQQSYFNYGEKEKVLRGNYYEFEPERIVVIQMV